MSQLTTAIESVPFDCDRHPFAALGIKSQVPPVSASGISDYYRCQRYFMWRYRMGLVRRVVAATAALQGEWFHDTLRGLTVGETLDEIKARLDTKADEKIDAAVGPDGAVPQGLDEALRRMVAKSVAMGDAFLSLCRARGLPLVDKAMTEVLAVEEAIQSEVDVRFRAASRLIPIAGRLDLVTRDAATGEITIHDYKQTSQSPADRAATAMLEPQPWMYRLLSSTAHGDPRSCCHWIMRSPTIRQLKPTKKNPGGESYDAYLERVKVWFSEKAMEHPEDPPIVASTVVLDGPMVTPERASILLEVRRGCTQRLTADDFPRTGAPHSCFVYGRACPYHQLCTHDSAMWPGLVLDQYTQEFRYGSDSDSESELVSE